MSGRGAMTRSRRVRGFAMALVLASIAAGAAGPAAASPSPDHPGTAAPGIAAVRAAMERDLGLRGVELDLMLAASARAAELDARLRIQLGDELAGSWFDQATGSLRVGVTDPAAASRASAAGRARPHPAPRLRRTGRLGWAQRPFVVRIARDARARDDQRGGNHQ